MNTWTNVPLVTIPRGATPTFDFILEGVNLDDAANVYVSFDYYGGVLTKSGEEVEVSAEETEPGEYTSTVSVFLSQTETLAFHVGETKVQVNWTYPDGSRGSSEIGSVSFGKQILGEVVE